MKNLICVLVFVLSSMSWGAGSQTADQFLDTNGDNVINVADLLVIRNQLGKSGSGLNGDVDRNGVVNVADLLWVRNGLGVRVWREDAPKGYYYIQTSHNNQTLWHPTKKKITCFKFEMPISHHSWITRFTTREAADAAVAEYIWHSWTHQIGDVYVMYSAPVSIWRRDAYKETDLR